MAKKVGCPKGKIRVGDHCAKIGYNTSGHWSTLGIIREIEVKDRGNPFPKKLPYPDNTPVIWITLDPRKAVRYAVSADQWDVIDAGGPVDPSLMADLHRIKLKPNDKIITEDGDGGFLLLRRKSSV